MSNKIKRLIFLFLCFGLVGALTGDEDLSIGSKAPDFKLPSLEKDQTISLSDFVNKKIVIVHFWKSMWKECRAEFPHLLKILEANKEKPIQILSVNPINRSGKVEADAKQFKLPYPVLVGRDSDIAKNYKLTSLPLLVIIDKEGKVALYTKFEKAEEIQKLLDTLLK